MPRAWFPPAAAAAFGASLLAVLSGSIVAARLPAMSCSLHADPSRAPLIAGVYLAAAGVGLPLGGLLGDAAGRGRLIACGAALLAVGSGVCAVAADLPPLLAGRFAQGAAAALILPNAVALIGTLPDARSAPHRMPTYSAGCTLATVAGPVLGGWASGCGAWRLLFLAVALAGSAMSVVAQFSAAGPSTARRALAAPRRGWRLQARGLASREMVALNLFTLCFFGAALSLLPLLPLFLARSREPASALLPISLGPVLLAPIVTRLQGSTSPGVLLALAAASLGLATLVFRAADPAGGYVAGVLPGALLTGLALALAAGPLSAALLASAAPTGAGLAAGLNSAAARLGGAGATMLLAPAFARHADGLRSYRDALTVELLLAALAAGAALSFLLATRPSAAPPLSRLPLPTF